MRGNEAGSLDYAEEEVMFVVVADNADEISIRDVYSASAATPGVRSVSPNRLDSWSF